MNPQLDYGMRERTRDHYLGWVAGEYFVTPFPTGAAQHVTTAASIRTHERTVDKENTGWSLIHAFWKAGRLTEHQKKFWRKQDLGGPFLNEKQTYSQVSSYFFDKKTIGSQASHLTYANTQQCLGWPVGAITPTSSVWPVLSPDDEQELWGLGSTAIKHVAPVVPQAGLSTFLGELREGIPKLSRKFYDLQSSAGSVSGNYLAYQFGLAPFIRDVKSISQTIINMDKELARLEEQSGDLLHRKYSFDDTSSESFVGASTVQAWPGAPSNVHPGTGLRSEYLLTKQKTWFTGAFSFWFPHVRQGLQELGAYLDVLGAGLNVDTLYNLTPYSWLADWFGNFGDVLFNLSYLQTNSQVVNYGYLMRHSTVTRRFEWQGTSGRQSYQDFTVERKMRIKASPFGFGLTDKDLTPYQWSILAALGVNWAT
jgi:hypothetical protein